MASTLWYVVEWSYTYQNKDGKLTLKSSNCRRTGRLLLRQANPQRPRHFLDHALGHNHRA